MVESRAKLRFPRTLFSPFASCKAHKFISDVINHQHNRRRQDKELIIPQSSTSMEPLLPPLNSPSSTRRPISYPSLCKPRCPDTLHEMVKRSCILSSANYHKLSPNNRCPPASPVSPLLKPKKLKQKLPSRKQKTEHSRDWFSTDDEREGDDETEFEIESPETLFSASTSSSRSSYPGSIGSNRTRRKPPSARRREARRKRAALEENGKETFAVVRSSTDPYIDFKASMEEMIMENSIFDVGELEQLLWCFLSLNSPYHHKVIVEVFAEICDDLFFKRFGL